MNRQNNRKYVSPGREQKAAATKNRMLDAAERLLLEKGFAGMTVADVAKRAGVSPQTVYAVFSSKAGIIMAAIEDRVLHDDRNVDTIKQLQNTTDPVLILKSIASIVRTIYDGSAATFTAVHGACVVSPQLADLENELGELRLQKQTPIAVDLLASGKLLPGMDTETVRDIIWTLTSRDIYYLLVVRRGWSPEKYERQLYTMLVSNLVHPDAIKTYLTEDGTELL